MKRVLITGGTGILGQQLVPRLLTAGYTVRIMSRGARRPETRPEVEWAQAQLATGAGIAHAVANVDIIVHAASTAGRDSQEVDVGGTHRLLAQARGASVDHFLYISIVGVDRIPFGYYQNKRQAELLVEQDTLPWTVLRATQFHPFIALLLDFATRLPVLAVLPTDFQVQPIAPADVARRVVKAIADGPGEYLPGIGGPEVRRLGHLARSFLSQQGRRRRLIRLPVPGTVAAGFRNGHNTVPENKYGTVTWEQWLAYRQQQKEAPALSPQELS